MTNARARLRDRLAAGTTRNLGCANEVAREALHHHALVKELIDALDDKRIVVAHRAANALKKIQRSKPELLAPFAKQILKRALATTHMHTRWSLTIILGELPLRGRDKALAVDLMFEALSSRSALQRTFALQALANYAQNDAALRTRVQPVLQRALTDTSAAIRARARKLQKQLAGNSFRHSE
jgi:fumarylacetoacetate (FAA) hydrolase family protein